MIIILNENNEFLSRNKSGVIEFTTDFSKAEVFDTEYIAKRECKKNGIYEGSVRFENI